MFSTLLWVPNHFPQEKFELTLFFIRVLRGNLLSCKSLAAESFSSVVQVLFQALKEFKADISTPPFSVFRADQM